MDITDTLKAIIILDADGQRLMSKSMDEKTNSKQFERKLFVKTKSHRVKDEILVVDGLLIIHRFKTDLHIYVIGNKNENPLILESVLNCLVEVISTLVKNNLERSALLDNLSQIIIALDEISDNGMLFETNPHLVLERVTLKDAVVEQSMAQKLQSATEHIKFPWIRG